MRLENATCVPNIVPFWREPAKPGRAAREAFSPTGKRAATCVVRGQGRLLAPAGGVDELLEGLRAGSPFAVEALFDRFHVRIFNLAMSILKNESDAEEATLDVFMTVIRKADTFQGNSAFYSWIYRFCVDTCFMSLRRKKRNDTVSIE